MNFWIVLLIMLVLLSPLTWLRQSSRQKGRMNMRLQARRLGLGMQLARPQWPHWFNRQVPAPCPQYYLAHRRRLQQPDWRFWQDEQGNWINRWQEPCTEPALLASLQQLPRDVYGVECNAQVIALFWGEAGGQEQLQQVLAFCQARQA